MELAKRIALMPPVALSLSKRSLNRTQDLQGYSQSMSSHFDVHMLAHGSDETRQFMERTIGRGATGLGLSLRPGTKNLRNKGQG